MKKFASIVSIVAMAFAVVGCNTWQGVKQDAREAGQATGRGIEKAGEAIQDVAK